MVERHQLGRGGTATQGLSGSPEPERCAECGFDGSRLTTADSIAALRTLGRRWHELFKDVREDLLRRRPDPKTWSPLEYAAHTRDVIAMNSWAMHQALEGSTETYPEVTPDEDAPDHGHNALDLQTVLDELAANAERMAARAGRVVGAEPWTRTVKVGEQDIDAGWFLRHAVHDATHHLRDVEHGLTR